MGDGNALPQYSKAGEPDEGVPKGLINMGPAAKGAPVYASGANMAGADKVKVKDMYKIAAEPKPALGEVDDTSFDVEPYTGLFMNGAVSGGLNVLMVPTHVWHPDAARAYIPLWSQYGKAGLTDDQATGFKDLMAVVLGLISLAFTLGLVFTIVCLLCAGGCCFFGCRKPRGVAPA